MQLHGRAAEIRARHGARRRSKLLPASELDAAQDRRRHRDGGGRVAAGDRHPGAGGGHAVARPRSTSRRSIAITPSSWRRSTASSRSAAWTSARPSRPACRRRRCSSSPPTSRRCRSTPTSTRPTSAASVPASTSRFASTRIPPTTFIGTVTQIRLQPVVVQNVTTYGTVITVPNRELKLKPGMTANVKIEIAKRTNALRMPNAALRFRPTAEVFAALQSDAAAGGDGLRRRRPRRPRRPRRRRMAHSRRWRGQQHSAGARGCTSAQRAATTASRRACRCVRRAVAAAASRGGRAAADSAAVAEAADRRRRVRRRRRRRPAEFQARMLERFKTMSPEEQTAVPRAHEGARRRYERRSKRRAPSKAARRKRGAAASPGAQTIDALFAPLPPVESRGRAWLYHRQAAEAGRRCGSASATARYTELLSRRAAGEHRKSSPA